MDDCLFCRIVAGKIPATVVYEDDDVMAINDVFPRAPFHVLVVPRKHVAKLSELDDEPSEGSSCRPSGGWLARVVSATTFAWW